MKEKNPCKFVKSVKLVLSLSKNPCTTVLNLFGFGSCKLVPKKWVVVNMQVMDVFESRRVLLKLRSF